MKNKIIEFGGLELSLRLDGKSIFNIEKSLNQSIMGLMVGATGGMKIPPINEMLIVLHGANEKHGITRKDVFSAFEKYLEEGNTTLDIFQIITELLEDSGFFGKMKETTPEEEITFESQVNLDEF
ncbi:DUF6096 family protein [Vagococcus intermedius]|uniref:DUF6096 family protein n=1 Tax=Vagococcus intermedius TaxID=2991418 RepID=A0AAF0CX48_9ENTE|nr:DUF6096 family protein [Vagococcus intermedius]WEG74418.1 DUF6096 family protein [Vagococcus intermedius]WEG76538.1 DUF6096 family protein [Vagococcus intermedius]